MPVPPVLSAIAVSKSYGERRALDQVSFAVSPGECVAIVGESGSGKTTLLRVFNRMVDVDAGSVAVNGADVTTVDAVQLRRGVGYVPQDGGLFPHWTVERNAALLPWLMGRRDARALGAAALEAVGLPPAEFGARRPAELSGGQRQRVAIARAIAAQPAVILLDEPFGALDAITRSEVQRAFALLQRRLQVTAVLVTHDLAEACRLADRIAVMRAGRMEQIAPPAELLATPATGYVSELLQRAGATPAWLA